MSHTPATEKRVLAIDPTHRGLGYVIFEGPERLIDWGGRHVSGGKNHGSIAAVEELISHWRPQVLVLEELPENSKRRRRVRQLLSALEVRARERGLAVRRISGKKIKHAFEALGIRNKYQMACFIAARFTELARHVPRERKPWTSEDLRMAMFDASNFALVFFDKLDSSPGT